MRFLLVQLQSNQVITHLWNVYSVPGSGDTKLMSHYPYSRYEYEVKRVGSRGWWAEGQAAKQTTVIQWDHTMDVRQESVWYA